MLGNRITQTGNEVPMGIDDAEPVSLCDVLHREAFKQVRFSGSGSPDDVHVMQSVGLLNTKEPVRRPAFSPCEIGDAAMVDHDPTIPSDAASA